MTTEQKRGEAPKALTQGEAKRSPVKEETPFHQALKERNRLATKKEKAKR